MNYAGSLDVYELWAEVLLTQNASYSKLHRFSGAFAGRRNSLHYKNSANALKEKYADEWISTTYLPTAYAQAMGDEAIIMKFTNEKTRSNFFKDAFAVIEKEKGNKERA